MQCPTAGSIFRKTPISEAEKLLTPCKVFNIVQKNCQNSDIYRVYMSALKKTLEKIRFTAENGLVFCDKPESEYIGEHYHIHEKAKKMGADAVFFRRKYDNNNYMDSKPVLYIYNREENFFNSREHKELHATLWSAGDIELYVIVSDTRIDIFNARKPAEVGADQQLSLDSLCLASEALEKFSDQRFSAIVFGKGIFGEHEDFNHQLSEKDSPFHRLLEYLMVARENLITDHPEILPETIDKLLIICILIKFSERIGNDEGNRVLDSIFETHEISDFAEALETGKCIEILEELGRKFDGNIFDRFSEDEKQQIKKANLKSVADFLNARLDITKKHKQRFLWEQYDFEYLPIELISSVYENFLQTGNSVRERGIIYTPPFLVNFLIDETMPLNHPPDNCFDKDDLKFRVLDPSCGSGIFLVAAYKRMLQWWSIRHYQKTNEIRFPTKDVCQKILEDNIFGIDIHKTAALITVFSLTIALLNRLGPDDIRNHLKLNSLKNNILNQDFFEWASSADAENKKFDLVIGNPPFNPKSGIRKKEAVSDAHLRLFKISNQDIPNNNFALKFFEGAMFFGRRTCLILPSNALLYSKKSQAYRMRIFTKFTIEKIFDFTHLRKILFIKKIPKHSDNRRTGNMSVCAVLANPSESKGQAIEHIVVRHITSSENKITVETDHYDRHVVRHDWASDETKQFIWKTDLLGGGRLFHLIDRLSLLENLNSFIENKKKHNDEWIFQDGYKNIIETSDRTIDYIHNRDKVSGIEDGEIISYEKEAHKDFGRPRPEHLYRTPLIVIHKKIGDAYLPVGIRKRHKDIYLVFDCSFAGIHAPEKEFGMLEKIYHRLKQYSDTHLLWLLATSPSAMIRPETVIRKTDLETLPFPEKKDDSELSETEKILQNDVLKYYVHSDKAISKKGSGWKLNKKVSTEQLESFGKVFCDVLNQVYAENAKSWQRGKFYQTQLLTIYQFVYGKNLGVSFQIPDDSDDLAKLLIYNDSSHRGAVFTRVCRYYTHLNGYDGVLLIKPNAMRYWLDSVAIRDADETFTDLKEAALFSESEKHYINCEKPYRKKT